MVVSPEPFSGEGAIENDQTTSCERWFWLASQMLARSRAV
jgi:hypothetical protein